MKIIRLEAMHRRGGYFCRFFLHEEEARAERLTLEPIGWVVTVKTERLQLRLDGQHLRLLEGSWPMAPTQELLFCRRQVPAVVGGKKREQESGVRG